MVRYDPHGVIRDEIILPVTQPTCAAFGGEDLSLLCVTSAWDGLSAEDRVREPRAGDVFIYSVDVPGVPELGFRPA